MRRKSSMGTTIFNVVLGTLMFVIAMRALVYAHALVLALVVLAILYAIF